MSTIIKFLLTLLLSTATSTLYNSQDKTQDHAAQAIKFDAAGADDEAEQAFRAAVKFNPTSVSKSLNLAVALLRYNKLEESRRAFEHTFLVAHEQKKPLKRLLRNLQLLKKEWQEVHLEEMDPINTYNSKHDTNEIKFNQKLKNVPLYMLAERKYLDRETADRGKDGLESRISTLASDIAKRPPKTKILTVNNGMDSLLTYLGSNDFQHIYWEQWPLLIRAPNAMDDLVSLEYLLKDGPYGYGSEKTQPPHRNVNFLKREFRNKDSIPKDKKLKKNDLLDGMNRNYTLQMLGTHYWIPSIANMSYWLSQVTSRPVSVNLYATPENQEISLVPHSDFQCALMVQMEGRKRWRLWKLPDIWLPVRYRHIRGRDEGDLVNMEWLGEPYMDVILYPGDVLYVPRGCIHLTSTVNENDEHEKNGKKRKKNEKKKNTKMDGAASTVPKGLKIGQLHKKRSKKNKHLPNPSIHLTVGMEAMWDHGVSASWEAFFGAGEFFHHDHVVESYYKALGNLIDKDIRFRETLPIDFMKDDATYGLNGDGASDAFVQGVRDRMYTMVDEMIDETSFIKRIRRLMLLTKAKHNTALKELVERASGGGSGREEL